MKIKSLEFTNIYKMFLHSANIFLDRRCLGVRNVLHSYKCIKEDKIQEQLLLDDKYVWQTYGDVRNRIIKVAVGLREIPCLNPKGNVIIYGDTSVEWFVCAMACFKNNYKVVTMYPNLGNDGIR